MTWLAILGITSLVALALAPARCAMASVPPGYIDSLVFASLSTQVRPDATIHVYPTSAPANPLMLRGYHLATWGVREGLVRVPGQSAARSELLRWDEIDRVEVKRTSAKAGAAIGAATFGALYLALAIPASSVNGGARGSAAFWIYGVNTGLAVGLGRIIGKSIGSRFRKWETVYVSHPSER